MGVGEEEGGCRAPYGAAQKINKPTSFAICFSLWLFKNSMRKF